MSLGDIYEDKVLDALFGAIALTVPANFKLRLSTTTPNDDGTGVTEPVGNGYSHIVIANNKTTWGNASASVQGQLENAIDLVFPQATGPWGTITHWVLEDDSTGDYVQSGTVSPPKSPDNGDIPKFLTGELKITAD